MNPPKLENIQEIGFVILYILLLLVPSFGIYKVFKLNITNNKDEKMMVNVVKGIGVLGLIGVMYAIIMELLMPAIEKMDKDE